MEISRDDPLIFAHDTRFWQVRDSPCTNMTVMAPDVIPSCRQNPTSRYTKAKR